MRKMGGQWWSVTGVMWLTIAVCVYYRYLQPLLEFLTFCRRMLHPLTTLERPLV